MSRRRERGLSPEDRELWQSVARTARPMHPKPLPFRTETPKTDAHSEPRKAPVAEFHIGASRAVHSVAYDLAPTLTERLAQTPVRMDRKTHVRMTKGKLTPERRIDLHGMTLAEAHPALIRFVLSSHESGLRLVLVITGKGRRGHDDGPIPQRPGALKHQVPHWLAAPPLGTVVLQVSQAHHRHGGTGAYYVYLRRRG